MSAHDLSPDFLSLSLSLSLSPDRFSLSLNPNPNPNTDTNTNTNPNPNPDPNPNPTSQTPNFSDLRAIHINFTLKRSPELSDTQGLMDRSIALMPKLGVSVE